MKLGLMAMGALFVATCIGCTSSNAESAPAGPASFVGDVPGEGATVFLRGQPAGPAAAEPSGRVVVDVVARGAADVHGAAFRVTWDPQALTFVSAAGGAVWSKHALAFSKEGTPGQLAVTWTEKGETGIDATNEVVLGTLVFDARSQDARSRKDTAIAFRPERSRVVDKKGGALVVAWRGGAVSGR